MKKVEWMNTSLVGTGDNIVGRLYKKEDWQRIRLEREEDKNTIYVKIYMDGGYTKMYLFSDLDEKDKLNNRWKSIREKLD